MDSKAIRHKELPGTETDKRPFNYRTGIKLFFQIFFDSLQNLSEWSWKLSRLQNLLQLIQVKYILLQATQQKASEAEKRWTLMKHL